MFDFSISNQLLITFPFLSFLGDACECSFVGESVCENDLISRQRMFDRGRAAQKVEEPQNQQPDAELRREREQQPWLSSRELREVVALKFSENLLRANYASSTFGTLTNHFFTSKLTLSLY